MPFLLTFWKPIAGALAVLVVALAFLAAKHSYDEGKREEGRAEVQAKFDAYIKSAQERSSALALAWDQKRQQADEAAKGLTDERAKRLAESTRRAQTLPAAVAAVVVPAGAVGVLDAAIRASEPAPAGSAGEPVSRPAAAPAATADSTVGLITAWGVQVVDLYDACRAQVIGWQGWYASLRGAQPAEAAP